MPKIIHVTECGGPQFLTVAKVARTEPGPGEVRFAVEAFALNRADILYITGNHYTELTLPSRVGSEACGVVDAIGDGVSAFKVGDRVSAMPFFSPEPHRHGVHGEFAILPQEYVGPWPDQLNAIEGCSIWMQYLTAYFAMKTDGKLEPGKSVLLTAAASSAGLAAVQTAKLLGAKVIATTRTEAKRQILLDNGADHVIITRLGESFADQIMSFTDGKGVNLVFDPISGDFISDYIEAMAWEGHVQIYGMLNGLEIRVSILPLVRNKVTIAPYSMYNYMNDATSREEGISFVLANMGKGKYRPHIDSVFAFESTVDAFSHMEGNTQSGKITVAVSENAHKLVDR